MESIRTIYLAGGCFWGLEKYIEDIDGVVETTVGYANGYTENPSYEAVCSGETGFAETVKVVYDSDVLNLKTLLFAYFEVIDPTSMDRQGNDRGSQYRTGVFYSDESDRILIEQVVAQVQKKQPKRVVTEIKMLDNYYEAEPYHQKYLDKNPNGYCHIPRWRLEQSKNIGKDI